MVVADPVPSEGVAAAPIDDELLRTLVDSLSAMLAFWDRDLRCRFANRAYERWFGIGPAALVGRHITELLGPRLLELNRPYIEGALRGEPQVFEREFPDPSGGPPRDCLVNLIPQVVGGVVRGFFSFATDISVVKRAERALREAEERFRLTLDEAPIGMALVATDGRFIRVNRALCDIVGYPAEELAGMTFQAITHPDDLDADLALAGRLVRGEIPRYTLGKRYVRKDRSIVDIRLSVSILRGSDGAPVHFIAQIEDVTQQKRLAEELRLAEARSSGILAISADGIVSIDEDQRITMFNSGAEKIFGYTRAEVIGAPVDVLIPERFRERHRRHVQRFAEEAKSARQMGEHIEICGLRKDGEEFPAGGAISRLQVDGQKVLTVALRDLTEQKRAEHEQRFLAEVGAILATTLDYEETLTKIAEVAVHSLADLCIVDLVEDDGAVRRLKVACRDPANAWLCEELKALPLDGSRRYLLRSVLDTRCPLLLQRPSEAQLAAFARTEEQLQTLRAANIRSLLAVPLLARDQLLGALAFVSSTASRPFGPADVRLAEGLGQRAALSIENARLFREARRATQARDEVLGVVAHDLRNPLGSILVQTALLRRRTDGPGRLKAAEVIERATRRMSRLIQDLLDVTRIEAGRLSVAAERVSARQLVVDSFEAQRALAAAASLELGVDAAPELPDVWADRDRLLQVFENLIGNALKFTGRGGRVTIGAAPREREVLFWVTDTGRGITGDELPRLFDRFWQAGKAEKRGAGLGLSIVKGVVEAHGGRIWAESAPGAGSSFFFTIPTADAASEPGRLRRACEPR